MAGGVNAIGRLLGKVSSANALVVALDGAIPGYVQGSGATGRVAFWSAADTITSDSDFTYASDILGTPRVLTGDGTAASAAVGVGNAGNGWYRADNRLVATALGAPVLSISGNNGIGLSMLPGFPIGFNSTPGVDAPNVLLYGVAANTLALRNGTNAQTFQVGPLANTLDMVGPAAGAAPYLQGLEGTAPASAPANSFRLFAQDNGGGKTQLMVIFATGAAQQVAIEP